MCRQIPQSSQLRDTDWVSTTCTLSSATIGIWPENADGTDVNTCDRSHDKKLVATGDDFGKVKLFSYPVTQPKVLNKFEKIFSPSYRMEKSAIDLISFSFYSRYVMLTEDTAATSQVSSSYLMTLVLFPPVERIPA